MPTPSKEERRPNDQYMTPAWCVEAILPFLPMDEVRYLGCLEPSCGDGGMAKILGATGDYYLTVVEIDGDLLDKADFEPCFYVEEYRADFLAWRAPRLFDLCVMNPPYLWAEDHVTKAKNISREVWALLSMSFLGGVGRLDRDVWRGLAGIYPLLPRPRFMGAGKGSDMRDSAWFHWSDCATEGQQTIRHLSRP